jgi:serine protease AprX
MSPALHRLGAAFAVLALLVGASLIAAPATATSEARLSPTVSEWLSTATDDATFEAIVTFQDRSGLSRFDGLEVAGTRLSVLPMAFATLTAEQLREVASWPETRSVWHDEQLDIHLDESVPLIGADRVWRGEGLRGAGYTGLGVGVAVIDTGVDLAHPDLPPGTVRSFMPVGDPFDPDGVVVVETETVDTYGHGTHVSSTVAGLGTASAGRYTGVAPGATVFSFKTDAGLFLLTNYALASFDWILANPQEGIRISSNSWGSGGGNDYDPDNPINVATKALYDAGVSVIFSAGNAGSPDSLNQYSVSPWVISAAAGTKDRALADFSSRGRLADNWNRRTAQRSETGIYRPTITAPGVDIVAAKSTQAVVMAGGTQLDNPFYTSASGTSMSAPHIAGTVALMLEARPQLQPAHVITILEGTADNMPDYELFEAGVGYLNAHAAVEAAERGRIGFPPSVNGRTPQYTLVSSEGFDGIQVLPNTWDLRECPDTTGLLEHHEFEVTAGTDAIFTEIEWDLEANLLYLVLYDPDCEEAGVSAALLDIGSVNHRSLIVTNPAEGTWTVAVYGRINGPTPYSGSFQTYEQN